jgi:hypothetical protein
VRKEAPYCMDTSALIAAWDERYPPENFPQFWERVNDALMSGLMVVPECVIDELMKKSKDLAAWIKLRPIAIISYEPDIQVQGKNLLRM